MMVLMNILHLISTTALFTFTYAFAGKKRDGKKEQKNEPMNADGVILQPSFGILDKKDDKKNKDDGTRDTFKDSDKIAPIFTKDKRDDKNSNENKKESDDKDEEKAFNNEVMGQSSYKPPMVTMLLNKNKEEEGRKAMLAEYDQLRQRASESLNNIYNIVTTMDKLVDTMKDEDKKGEEKKRKSSAPEERIDYKIIEVTDNDGK